VGTLTSDTPNAVIGEVGAQPGTIPVHVTATNLDTHRSLTLDSQVADETDIGNPDGTSLISLVAPLAVAQAATQIYDGAPASETGKLCLTISLRETRVPLRFCNRYSGTGAPGDSSEVPPELASATSNDVAAALGILDSVDFAKLHVTNVAAGIEAQSGLVSGRIVSARAPINVKPGQVVRVGLVVRTYRGPLRAFSFPIRIPHGARGPVVAQLKGPSAGLLSGQADIGSLSAALTAAFGGGPISSGSGPSSMTALAHRFAAIGHPDGLQLSFNGHRRTTAYENPSLLITGSARLIFNVRR
jgi:hypothetical protein